MHQRSARCKHTKLPRKRLVDEVWKDRTGNNPGEHPPIRLWPAAEVLYDDITKIRHSEMATPVHRDNSTAMVKCTGVWNGIAQTSGRYTTTSYPHT
jgi:hypothetical protein